MAEAFSPRCEKPTPCVRVRVPIEELRVEWDGIAKGRKAVSQPLTRSIWLESAWWRAQRYAEGRLVVFCHEWAHVEGACCETCADFGAGLLMRELGTPTDRDALRALYAWLDNRTPTNAMREVRDGFNVEELHAQRWPAELELARGLEGDFLALDALSRERDAVFSFAQLWPYVEHYASAAGFDARILAGMVEQESSWKNHIVHADGTGHGLLGLDDGGLLADFEAWVKRTKGLSSYSAGRGYLAVSIPPEWQLEYAALKLADYSRRLGGPWQAARAWHRGEGNRKDAKGDSYEAAIRTRVAKLFPGEPMPGGAALAAGGLLLLLAALAALAA